MIKQQQQHSNQVQVFELSCAQREAEEHRIADSASAQESLMSVSAKYDLALNIIFFLTKSL